MKIGTAIKKALLTACATYTVFTVLLNLFLLASNRTDLVLNVTRTLWILLFSVIFGAAEVFRSQEQWSAGLRYPIHAIVTITAFCLCMILPAGVPTSPGTIFVLVILLAVVYALIFGISALVKSKLKKNSDKTRSSQYISQYKKGSDK